MQRLLRGNGLRAVLAAVLASVLLAGCAAMREHKRLDSLEASLQSYGTALRWGEWEAANEYRVPRKKSEQLKPMPKAELKHIRVTDYEIVQRVLSPDEKLARIRARITFYDTNTGAVHTLGDEQTWWYNDDARHWFLDGNLPDFAKVAE